MYVDIIMNNGAKLKQMCLKCASNVVLKTRGFEVIKTLINYHNKYLIDNYPYSFLVQCVFFFFFEINFLARLVTKTSRL